MEVRIKTGENLKCEYTNKKSEALVKIYPVNDSQDNGNESTATGWMGKEALYDALNLLNSIDMPKKKDNLLVEQPLPIPSQAPHLSSVPSPPVQQQPKSVKFPGVDPKDSIELVKQFESTLVELINNPTAQWRSKTEGLSETEVRDLVTRFKPAFRNKNAMFTPLKKHLGMEKDRFDILMEG